MKKIIPLSILLLLLVSCIPTELNSSKPAKQPGLSEPIKIFTYCPDHVICYVKEPRHGGIEYGGMWCTREQDLYDKYCNGHDKK